MFTAKANFSGISDENLLVSKVRKLDRFAFCWMFILQLIKRDASSFGTTVSKCDDSAHYPA